MIDLDGRDDTRLEIEGNRGTIILSAGSAREALMRARSLFSDMRDVSVSGTAERFLVQFKVGYRHNRRLFRRARRLVKSDLSRESFDELALAERYMALLHANLVGRKTFLGDPIFLRGALTKLRNEIRQTSGSEQLQEYDIAVHNLVESQP